MSSAFSPLEALLLFQYLSNYGVSPNVFSKISEVLNKDEQIRRSSSYDPGRLSPDALRDFYLRLLKEEARSEVSAAERSDGPNGEQSGSRKRKAPSPSLPTIQEASRNVHLIPQLIRKLYARYREHAIIEIKEDERRYSRLQRNISEIKSGAWDERLQGEIERGDWDQVAKRKSRTEERRLDTPVPGISNGTSKPPASRPQEEEGTLELDQRPSAPSLQSVTSAIAPQPSGPPYQQPEAQSPTLSPRHATQSPLHSAPHPTSTQQAPYTQPSSHHPPPPISPRPPDARPSSRLSQSPMLPPPPPSHTGSPFPPYPYANNAHPQQLPPNSPYASPQALPSPVQVPAGQYQQYTQHQPGHAPYQGAQGGVMLQPFAVAPQTPSGPRQQGQTPQNAPSARPGLLPRGPSFPPLSTSTGTGLSPFDIAKLLATPLTAKRLALGNIAPSPSKDTHWKALPGRANRGLRKSSPERPRSRDVSPISEKAASPPLEQDTARRFRRGKPLSSVPESVAPSRSTRTRRARGGSTASSVPGSSIRGRTRSQSVMSHAEDVSMMDNESFSGRGVKHEPSTPMESSDFVRPTIEGTPGQTARRALQSGLNKRKRGPREDSEASDAILASRQDKSVVIANKNFNRLSSTIMNDIQSHKHASLFSNAVRDRDAEGYSDIIRRPQDLKSIRMAVTAGNRAVNAATASDSFTSSNTTSQPSRSDTGGILVLPVSDDLVPPKAIVNSSQLEKEVMRMFANAVMFNPGDEGVVQDAREMADSVEGQIAKFREVERGAAAVLPTVSESGMQKPSEEVEDGGGAGVGKRRKIG